MTDLVPQASSEAPDVSVVIATYNMAQYLPIALKSVLAQVYGTVEVHVVDDGSTDNTKEVVEGFASDPRVHYHYQQNAGQTKAKNVGVRAAKGRYIGFCDADDLWTPNKLALQLPILDSRSEVAVVYTRMRPIDKDGALLEFVPRPEPSGTVTKDLFLDNFVPFGSALVRASSMNEVGGFDETRRMGIDWDLWLRMSLKYQFVCVPEETYLYRVWEGQMSRNWKGRYEAAFKIMADFERNHPGVIDAQTHRIAYGQSYLNRAQMRAKVANDRLGCVADAFRGARENPAMIMSTVRVLVKAVILHPYR